MHIAAGTLGEVLYAGRAPSLLESEWVELVTRIAAGEPEALIALYDRASDAVFTLFVRLTLDRELAEELLLQVFLDLRRHAEHYSPDATVLAWIMSRARSSAVDALRAGQHRNAGDFEPGHGLIPIDMPDYRNALGFREQSDRLAAALAQLTDGERRAIEAVYFDNGPLSADLMGAMRKLVHAFGAAQRPEDVPECAEGAPIYAYALHALPRANAAAVEQHCSSCRACRLELEALRPLVNVFFAWPRDLLRAPHSVRARLWEQLAGESAVLPEEGERQRMPGWESVAPGISCKLLATDIDRQRVSMLVRLVPGGEYPPHAHADVEELHLLDGELWIDDRKLCAGDYNRAEPGTSDKRVWSPTGCACVLVTSALDVLA